MIYCVKFLNSGDKIDTKYNLIFNNFTLYGGEIYTGIINIFQCVKYLQYKKANLKIKTKTYIQILLVWLISFVHFNFDVVDFNFFNILVQHKPDF